MRDWGGRVTYLLEQMEAEAQRRGRHPEYGEILKNLTVELDKHNKDGR